MSLTVFSPIPYIHQQALRLLLDGRMGCAKLLIRIAVSPDSEA